MAEAEAVQSVVTQAPTQAATVAVMTMRDGDVGLI